MTNPSEPSFEQRMREEATRARMAGCEKNRCYCRVCQYIEPCHTGDAWRARTAPGDHAFVDPHAD